jgi:putative DNA methylase
MTNDYKSFIEVQFPVSKISKESYKERKAGSNQTLTGVGKWWGRKPLILVRASILGLLMPSSDDFQKDREIFLKLLTMDNDSLEKRKDKNISTKEIYENLTTSEKLKYFRSMEVGEPLKYKYKSVIKAEDKLNIQKLIFSRFSYDKKLEFSVRPEGAPLIKDDVWKEVNDHLGTNSADFQELIKELGRRRFGKKPLVGDAFCGGGSIPFESGRSGCDVYGSDLNPIAGLLTWSDLNILSLPNKEIQEIKDFKDKVYDSVVKQIEEWGIEENEKGWRAKYYLYCTETICPECGVNVPLCPNWIISDGFKVVAELKYNEQNNNFDILIKSNVSKEELKKAKENSTIKDGSLYCPHCKKSTSIISLRKDKKNTDGNTDFGLRLWNKSEFIPQKQDIYKERLYCIKYMDKFEGKTWEDVMKKPSPATDACYGNIHYCTPTAEDICREIKTIELLSEKFQEWQEKGYIPSNEIDEGYNTTQVIRERGWKFWHQLFNPRQLLTLGLFMESTDKLSKTQNESVVGLLGINKCADWNSKLSIWNTARDVAQATYTNQALNTLYNYPSRTLCSLYPTWSFVINKQDITSQRIIELKDASKIDATCDIWITDPPYADAVNYHELTEFFLAWDKKMLLKTFPDWYGDSKRALAVRGVGQTFNNNMIEIYKNLASHMPDNGMQIVMFTHQDVKVWAELTMILWSAGLRVVSAWNIATETESGGLKNGNYVKGTVLLVLKKQLSNETAFQDDLYPEIKEEVKRQIDSMRTIDKGDETNFTDADYLLASYASSLKVLTTYKQIEGIDIQYELSKSRNSKDVSPIEEIINKSIKIAYDYLIPAGFDNYQWKLLTSEERFYIKGLEVEKNKGYQLGSYQELARGYGVNVYKDLLENTKANNVRFKTPMEFKNTNLQNSNFGITLTRNVIMAIYQSVKAEDTIEGKNWLKTVLDSMYWKQRSSIIEILNYFSRFEAVEHMEHWHKSSEYAKLLKEVIKNDGV